MCSLGVDIYIVQFFLVLLYGIYIFCFRNGYKTVSIVDDVQRYVFQERNDSTF